jgi:hypothetical protein
MSKIVKVHNSDYKVVVRSGGTITLDTGVSAGEVIVTGDLTVLGDLTSIETAELKVEDKIITLNYGQTTGTGIAPGGLGKSGIEIVRGTADLATLLFDDAQSYTDPNTAAPVDGLFVFGDSGGASNLRGIKTHAVVTGGGKLSLVGSGAGYVTVTGTNDYEKQILSYTDWEANGSLRPSFVPSSHPITVGSDDDAIPNLRGMIDYIDSILAYIAIAYIAEDDTRVETHDADASDAPSRITFDVDGVLRAEINNSGLDVDNINIFTNTISNTSANNLILTATNSNIEVNGYLNLDNKGSDPSSTAGTSKVYSKSTIGAGKTGLYFVNTTTSDELVSKKRALLFSMIF